ncbi:MAG: phosphoribosylanthranilate isomerase [Alcanivorax sp.]
MPYTRIKICGITRPEDAQVAAAQGADAIGLVFYVNSPRAVDIGQASEIASVVPPFMSTVALFVNEPAETIERILSAVSIDVIQFHGDESADFCEQFQRPYLKAIRVRPDLDLAAVAARYGAASAILLDSWQQGVPGGTGKKFDWQLADTIRHMPVVLAGGLTEENVGEAIARLAPAAVDVSGGVEESPGIKDESRISNFIRAVRSADALGNGKEQ